MTKKDKDLFDLLKEAGEKTTEEYPEDLLEKRRNKFILWTFFRTPIGCLITIALIVGVF